MSSLPYSTDDITIIEPSSSKSATFYILSGLALFFGLAFIGINVFAYLHSGSQIIIDTVNPFLNKWLGFTINLTSTIVDSTVQGGLAVASVTANVPESSIPYQQIDYKTAMQYTSEKKANDALSLALNESALDNNSVFEDDDIEEAVYDNQEKLKSGWCYIGTDRGHRSCAKIGRDDVCASDHIYSTNEKCVNPRLR